MTKQLFETIDFKSGVSLKNRIVISPMTTQSAYYDGSMTEELIEYYAHRSGEVGAVIVESAFVENYGRGFFGAVGIDTDDKIEGLSRVAKAIQAKGSKAFIQIYHAGRMGFPNMNGGRNPISASPVAALRPNAPVPTEMTHQEVLAMIDHFAEGVRRAIKAGFDGVELHGANTFLLQQFFSPHSNRRTDAWGGSREKRAKFATEVVKAAKRVMAEEGAENFVLGYRFSPEELEEPGIRFEDTMYLLHTLAEYDLDYFHFSMGIYTRGSIVTPDDPEMLISKFNKLKSGKLAETPIIGVGNIRQTADAQGALEAGYDVIAVGQGFLIEPNWVEKIRDNQEVRPYADVSEREALVVPTPLWHYMDEGFGLVKDIEAEKAKAERLKELMSKPLEFTPGQYHVTAQGHNSELPMVVTFDQSRIIGVEIDSEGESAGLSDLVFERMPKQIIEFQTLNVDAVSGASSTSKGVIDGVSDAVRLASGQDAVDVLKARQKPVIERSTEVLEEEVDVVIVGGGAAGIATSLRADELGLKATLIEKLSFIGGAISVSGGNQVVTGSRLQVEEGVSDDTPELMAEDFLKNGNNQNVMELLNLLANNVGAATDWVHDYIGVEYDMAGGLHVLAEYRKNRELAYAHGGHGFAASVREKMAASNVNLLLQTKAEKLLTDGQGNVTGLVAVEENGITHRISAKAVVLTTGGYGNNKAMLSDALKDVLFYGTRSSMGEGVQMAQAPEVDAATRMMELGKIYPNGVEVSPGTAKSTIGGNIAILRRNGILVNTNGQRVINERASNHEILDVLMEQDPKLLYLLMDQETFDIFRKEIAEGGISEKEVEGWLEANGSKTPFLFYADTLEGLADLAGMDTQALADTVARFNQFVENGKDEDFGRQVEFLQTPVGAGPYYMIEQKPRFATTMGGLVVNEKLEVQNNSGKTIGGLYAAGEVVGGVMGTDSPSGANNAWALTSGKLAAENIQAK
ncbi:fumarate reductase flavoprotein subunit [Streptococcus gallinaceus]|uniref:oxidoreductase n=1 Tax=Streptococcus gallinaceus TaxID=165758 RepID=UPI00209E3ED3|nr:FAD-binding protein [Streptococcus gallinaceus]MCP1639139.1 fumarate reductase flavoprotein subunit [Streptococcus gallinaceus]MCP1769617.1 fumarate reductase flavoprotein subunit [Streptococcus gallinaceus]